MGIYRGQPYPDGCEPNEGSPKPGPDPDGGDETEPEEAGK